MSARRRRSAHLAGASADPRDPRIDAVEAAVLLRRPGRHGLPLRQPRRMRLSGRRHDQRQQEDEHDETTHGSTRARGRARVNRLRDETLQERQRAFGLVDRAALDAEDEVAAGEDRQHPLPVDDAVAAGAADRGAGDDAALAFGVLDRDARRSGAGPRRSWCRRRGARCGDRRRGGGRPGRRAARHAGPAALADPRRRRAPPRRSRGRSTRSRRVRLSARASPATASGHEHDARRATSRGAHRARRTPADAHRRVIRPSRVRAASRRASTSRPSSAAPAATRRASIAS